MSAVSEQLPSTATATATVPSTNTANTATASPSSSWWDNIVNFKKNLGLRAPGSADQVDREIRGISVDHMLVHGANASFEKGLGDNLAIGHEYKIGTGPRTNPSAFNYTAIYHTPETVLQGKIDGSGNLNGVAVKNWAKWFSTRMELSRGKQQGQEMFGLNLSADYTGNDFDLGLKLQQPNPLEGTGACSLSLLQSITRGLSLGLAYQYAQHTADMGEANLGYLARYRGSDWIATAHMNPAAVECTYHQTLSDTVSVGTTLRTGMNMQTGRPETVATAHAKCSFHAHEVTTHVDSTGKMATSLMVGLAPSLFLNLSGDVDQYTSLGKFGIGLMMRG